MTSSSPQLFWAYAIGIALLFIIGFYCIIVTLNLVRALIGLEILTKAVTLLLILAGKVSGQETLAQSFVITLIIIEVVVVVIAAGIVIGIFRKYGSVDVNLFKRIRG